MLIRKMFVVIKDSVVEAGYAAAPSIENFLESLGIL